MIFDSDQIDNRKNANEILRYIIDHKSYTVIHGAAGSGKTTMATRLYGNSFIHTMDDARKADHIIVISGAARNKGGDYSKTFWNIVKNAKQVIAVLPSNLDIIARRKNRVNNPTDKRSRRALIATINAPLNDYSVYGQIKKSNKKVVVVK